MSRIWIKVCDIEGPLQFARKDNSEIVNFCSALPEQLRKSLKKTAKSTFV